MWTWGWGPCGRPSVLPHLSSLLEMDCHLWPPVRATTSLLLIGNGLPLVAARPSYHIYPPCCKWLTPCGRPPVLLVRSGGRRIGCWKLAIELNDIAIGIAQMGRTYSPCRSILRSSNGCRAAPDEIGIGGVNVFHTEIEHRRISLWGGL